MRIHQDREPISSSAAGAGLDPKLNPQAYVPPPPGCEWVTTTDQQLARQFVYGLQYIDEHVAQYSAGGTQTLILQDGNYNTVAQTDAAGEWFRQYSYQPYGGLLAADRRTPDGLAAIDPQYFHNESMITTWHLRHGILRDFETGLDYNRNRIYDPASGRFLQADPNGTGLILQSIMAINGQTMNAFASFSPTARYDDGMSPYEFARSSPVDNTDPTGLMVEWQDEYRDNLLLRRDWDRVYESIVGSEIAYLGAQGAATWGAAWGGNVTALPTFATGIAGVSEGFSEFADLYAQEVTYLPVAGALGGIGQFGHFATVGRTGDKARRTGRLVRIDPARIERHHAIPKFLGGGKWQRLPRLPKYAHDELHDKLRVVLRQRGFPTSLFGGAGGKTENWLAHFERYPGSQRAAFDAILEVSREVDAKYGTNVVQKFWGAVMKGRFRNILDEVPP